MENEKQTVAGSSRNRKRTCNVSPEPKNYKRKLRPSIEWTPEPKAAKKPKQTTDPNATKKRKPKRKTPRPHHTFDVWAYPSTTPPKPKREKVYSKQYMAYMYGIGLPTKEEINARLERWYNETLARLTPQELALFNEMCKNANAKEATPPEGGSQVAALPNNSAALSTAGRACTQTTQMVSNGIQHEGNGTGPVFSFGVTPSTAAVPIVDQVTQPQAFSSQFAFPQPSQASATQFGFSQTLQVTSVQSTFPQPSVQATGPQPSFSLSASSAQPSQPTSTQFAFPQASFSQSTSAAFALPQPTAPQSSVPFTFPPPSQPTAAPSSTPFTFPPPSTQSTFPPPSQPTAAPSSTPFTFPPPSQPTAPQSSTPFTFPPPSQPTAPQSSTPFSFPPPSQPTATQSSAPFSFPPPSSTGFSLPVPPKDPISSNHFGFSTTQPTQPFQQASLVPPVNGFHSPVKSSQNLSSTFQTPAKVTKPTEPFDGIFSPSQQQGSTRKMVVARRRKQ